MLLAQLVETSCRIADTTKRLEKTDLLTGLLKRLNPEEVEISVAFLSGSTRQGRIGIGYATVREATASAAENPTLEILEVDRTLQEVASTRGLGSENRKRELLNRMLSAATGDEQKFLGRLLLGELRQGALEG